MCGFDSWPINRLREWCALLSSHLCHEQNQKSTCKQLILISKAVKKKKRKCTYMILPKLQENTVTSSSSSSHIKTSASLLTNC